MKLKYGNLMNNLMNYKTVFITTNAFIKRDGTLVMGRGIAKAAAKMYPELPLKAGQAISGGLYGLIPDVHVNIGLFQVKFNWWDNASLELVEYSTSLLCKLATENPNEPYALNYPAIGNGHLSKDDVAPIIETLPDNVDVWQFEDTGTDQPPYTYEDHRGEMGAGWLGPNYNNVN